MGYVLNLGSVNFHIFKIFEGAFMEYVLNCLKYLHQLSNYSNNLIFIYTSLTQLPSIILLFQ